MLACLSIFLLGIPGIVAVILGIVALRRSTAAPTVYGGQGLAIAGIVVGGLSILFGGLLLVLAIPNLNKTQMAAREMTALQSIRTLHIAETQYFSEFGTYATTLAQLGPPPSGAPNAQAADLIPASLATGEKDGYLFTLTATPASYTINANPKVYNSTGRRAFFSDQSLTVRQNWGQDPATATSPELK